jgi:hypothetical protein
MATRNQPRDARQALYAVAGVADLAVSTLRQLPEEAQKLRDRLPDEANKLRSRLPEDAVRAYGNLVQRGESLVSSIRGSRTTQQAGRATRVAVTTGRAARTRTRSNVRSTRSAAKGATTTVRRAASADAKAARDAAGKVGRDK